jgi:hypothetical protein
VSDGAIRVDRAVLEIHRAMTAARVKPQVTGAGRVFGTHRLKARLRPMRGLKRDRSARVIVRGHALMQNLRRGHYELGVDARTRYRVAVAFTELAHTI